MLFATVNVTGQAGVVMLDAGRGRWAQPAGDVGITRFAAGIGVAS